MSVPQPETGLSPSGDVQVCGAPFRAPVDAIVVVAMDDEAQPFLDLATDIDEPRVSGRSEYRDLTLAGRRVRLVRGGIGLANAAAAATFAILSELHETGSAPSLVVSAGSAGGVDRGVRVGDIVVGDTYINIDADARAFGYVLGQVPGMPPAYTATEPTLAHPTEPIRMPGGDELRLVYGLIVSSDAFVSDERARDIRTLFPGAAATDMESVAIAQTCHVYGVPFIAVRGVSDLCGPEADSDFLTHIDDAAERSAVAVSALLARRAQRHEEGAGNF